MSQQIVPSSPFPIRIVGTTAANTTITGLVTTAIVSALMSVPIAGVQAVVVNLEQSRADIEVEFYRIGVETQTRKRLIAADTIVAAMYSVDQGNFPPHVKQMMLAEFQRQLEDEIRSGFR